MPREAASPVEVCTQHLELLKASIGRLCDGASLRRQCRIGATGQQGLRSSAPAQAT